MRGEKSEQDELNRKILEGAAKKFGAIAGADAGAGPKD